MYTESDRDRIARLAAEDAAQQALILVKLSIQDYPTAQDIAYLRDRRTAHRCA